MPNSYVIHETSVICTNMTSPKPALVVLYRNESNLPVKSLQADKLKFILNEKDNKLSCSLSCKMPQKFWGGLAALCVGIAFAAACVLTGGALLVVVAVALTVAAVSAGVGAYKTAHDCDSTLSYTWINTHPTVKIDQAPALLNNSIMKCTSNNGVLSIIIDPDIALEAAKQIAKYNDEEVGIHIMSQLFVGMVSGVVCGNPVSAVVNIVVNISFYCAFEPTQSTAATIGVGVTQTALGTAADSGLKYGAYAATENAYRNMAAYKTMQASTQVLGKKTMEEATEAAALSVAAGAAKSSAFSPKNMSGGLIAGAVTTGINVYADIKEKEAADKASALYDIARINDDKGKKNTENDLIATKI